MRKRLTQEDREFLKADYGAVIPIASLLKVIPEKNRTKAIVAFLHCKYSDYDLDLPFMEQFKRNQEKLIHILSTLTK